MTVNNLAVDWLLPLSLLMISGGITLSVYEEWAKSGLTDTSKASLACWIVGLCGVAVWGLFERDSWVFLVAIAPAALFSYWMFLKIQDASRHKRT
jgi:hypothetical protein